MERLDVFMARANAAYYATCDPFADFTTAPEISQVFGEVLGLWAAVTWQAMRCPDPVLLAEAGPGRGTLMRDALRAIRQTVPDFARALRVHFIETSARLRESQRALVPQAVWHDALDELPEGPLIFLANEFFDALPVRQFVVSADGVGERFVRDGTFVVLPCGDEALPPHPLGEGRGEGLAPGPQIHELNESAEAFVASLAARIGHDGGAALIIDYGPACSTAGDTLQALQAQTFADPLAAPGQADLTAHVDFARLAAVARAAGVAAHGPVPQGKFLAHLGLFQRTDRLAQGQPPARAAGLIEAAQRLAEPAAMGRLFKALALTHSELPLPPGFAA